MTEPTDGGRFQGRVEAQIEGLTAAVERIEAALDANKKDFSREMVSVREEIIRLRLWRSKITGVASAIAAAVSLAANWLWSVLAAPR